MLLGTGNVARHLYDAITKTNSFELIQVAGRSSTALEYFGKKTDTTYNFLDLEEADIYILALSDSAIGDVGNLLKNKDGLIVHTSGSTPLEVLPPEARRGVFYPLQTFTKEIAVDFRKVPLCLEAENEEDYKILEELAAQLSDLTYRVDSKKRQQLHIGAVYVNNFVNHLFHIGHSICKEQDLPFEILKPLIGETIRKIGEITPFEAQTGPARRQDQTTIDLHKKQIKNKARKEIYSVISNSIRSTYG